MQRSFDAMTVALAVATDGNFLLEILQKFPSVVYKELICLQRVFKKTYGKSPWEYRKDLLSQQG